MIIRKVRLFTVSMLAVVLAYLLTACGQSSPSVLRAPPVLTVSCGGEKVNAVQGTAYWSHAQGEMRVGTNYDSSGWSELKGFMTPLRLPNEQELTAYLTWEVMPDSVSVRFLGEEVPTERQSADGADCYTMQMKDGEYIYEVYAEWNSYEQYGGRVYYGFCTEK